MIIWDGTLNAEFSMILFPGNHLYDAEGFETIDNINEA